MKTMEKSEFEKLNAFGTGRDNTAYARLERTDLSFWWMYFIMCSSISAQLVTGCSRF